MFTESRASLHALLEHLYSILLFQPNNWKLVVLIGSQVVGCTFNVASTSCFRNSEVVNTEPLSVTSISGRLWVAYNLTPLGHFLSHRVRSHWIEVDLAHSKYESDLQ